jgi:hypothetical protein
VRGAGGEHPLAGWWDEEDDDKFEARAAALHHPVQQGQGMALSNDKAAAEEKEQHTSEALATT